MVTPFYRLAWKTYKALMMQQPLLLFTASRTFPMKKIYLNQNQRFPVQLLLISGNDFKRHDTNLGKVLPESFFREAHCIDDVTWLERKRDFSAVTLSDFDVPPLSLFLAKDHKLDTSTKFCIVDIETSALIFSLDFFPHFSYVNLSDVQLEQSEPNSPVEVEMSKGLNVVCCLELADRYEVEVAIRGVQVNTATGE